MGRAFARLFGSSSGIHPHPHMLGWFGVERASGNLLFQLFPLLPSLCQVRRRIWCQPHCNTVVPPYFSICPWGRELGDPHQGWNIGVGVPLKSILCRGPGLFLNINSPRGQFHILQKKLLRGCVSRTAIACLDKELILASSASIQSVNSCVSICCLCPRHFFWLKMKTMVLIFRLRSFQRFFKRKESQSTLLQDQIFY